MEKHAEKSRLNGKEYFIYAYSVLRIFAKPKGRHRAKGITGLWWKPIPKYRVHQIYHIAGYVYSSQH